MLRSLGEATMWRKKSGKRREQWLASLVQAVTTPAGTGPAAVSADSPEPSYFESEVRF